MLLEVGDDLRRDEVGHSLRPMSNRLPDCNRLRRYRAILAMGPDPDCPISSLLFDSHFRRLDGVGYGERDQFCYGRMNANGRPDVTGLGLLIKRCQ